MITPGDTYRSANSRETTRIRVEKYTPGRSHAFVVTLTPDGRAVRRRALEVRQLHDTPLTRAGQPRRTGYILARAITQGQPS
ncbi:hypothetical protein [Streptomyces sp. NPDC047315]|uniref:hypothetical protein n=1 Tax=Streptomyces sp. NPDC047315 TaxID=3155142 RepID=UPI0033D30BDF